MTKCIVRVFFRPESDLRNPKTAFSVIETDLPDFAAFCDAVDNNRLINGSVLWTRRSEAHGVMGITRRDPIAFRGEAVLRCDVPLWQYVDAENAA